MTRDIRNIVVLTGAGVSAESGVPTFRSLNGSTYWEVAGCDGAPQYHSIEAICTPEALLRDRGLVLDFYDQRRRALATVAPNAAHRALGRANC